MGILDKLKSYASGMPIYGSLFDDSEENSMEQLAKNQQLYEGIGLPNTKWKDYNPDSFQYAGDVNPEDAEYSQISEDPMLRSAQLAALSKMAGLSESGLTAEDNAAFARAQMESGRQARSSSEASLQNAQARGVSGGGLEFALREQGAQDAATRQQQAGLEQAATQARQRALYNQAYGNQLAGVRGQDLSANSKNADIINSFNMANTGARNTAALDNRDAQQGILNQNTATKNAGQMYNLEGARNATQQGFENQMSRAGGMSGANTAAAQGFAAQNASRAGDRNKNTDLLVNLATMGMSGGASAVKKKA